MNTDLREVAQGISRSRRDFLRMAAGVTLGSTLLGSSATAQAGIARKKRKVIVITFGGGARDQDGRAGRVDFCSRRGAELQKKQSGRPSRIVVSNDKSPAEKLLAPNRIHTPNVRGMAIHKTR